MMMDWREMALGELCSLRAGSAFKTHFQGKKSGKFPFIKVSDMNLPENEICIHEANNWVEEDVRAEIKAKPLPPGTTVFAKIGEALKQNRVRYLVRDTIVDNNMMGAVPDLKKVDPRFFFYCLSNFDIAGTATGTALPYLTVSTLSGSLFSVPPLPVQRRIASVLSAYDGLIENNQQRIRILEKMARSLYCEWFVHFRYPGHEAVPLVDSPLGQIPQGWEVKKLCDIAVVNSAQINTKNAPDELHYIDIASVSPGQIDYVTTYAFANAPGRARRVVQHGDVLWSCVRPNRRSHALVMHPETDTIASTGFAVLTAKAVPFTFLYCATTTENFVSYLTNNASGAAYPAVTAPTFEKAELFIPSPALLEQFGKATIVMAEQAHTLQRQTANLRRTRDLLLPRLLSGQVELATDTPPTTA